MSTYQKGFMEPLYIPIFVPKHYGDNIPSITGINYIIF